MTLKVKCTVCNRLYSFDIDNKSLALSKDTKVVVVKGVCHSCD